MGGKAPCKEFLKASKMKKPQRYQLGTVALCEIHCFQKSTDLLICKPPFLHLVHEIALEVGRFDLCFQIHAILTLQGGLFGWAPGRCQPLHDPCKTCNNHAQRHTISAMYLWRASSLLKVLLPKVCFSLSVGCRLCGILPVPGMGI